MANPNEVFRSNTLMIFIPVLFFGTALILRSREDLSVLIWILIAIGAFLTLALVLSFTTIIIKDQEIGIKNLKKSHWINKRDIVKHQRKTSFTKGIETVVWKIHLKSGEVVSISSDLIKEQEELKQSLDQFLKNSPKK
ncbi:hypothetical protein SAMN05421640_1987 [Ekhidna lutea]|uniref:PH domain-containing protein n=1 Tax=Ekhidna lutea TaxID=447679 RepID=A0A239J484_EKHLU|nr:hypothetical protein [Ekhidna lutea]SNT00836.1 hypothetical protein SAMN05421640_1987 [Ekhidna lutea]